MLWGMIAAVVLSAILVLAWAYRIARRRADERRRVEADFQQAKQRLEEKTEEVDRLRREVDDLRKRFDQRVADKTAQLDRSNHELQKFAYMASHDLQEPLRMIVSYTDLLKKALEGKLDPEGAECLEFVCDGAKRMQTLLRDLLAYSRIISGELALVQSALGDAVEQARFPLLDAIRESGAEIAVGALPEVALDVSKMALAIQNLLSNAIKFRKPGERPRIRIDAERMEAEWRIAVRDEGIGFDPRFSEKIFEVFQRLHPASRYPGTGMGLAISKRIVEAHGGRMWAESAAQSGATFFLTIPAHGDAPHSTTEGRSGSTTPVGSSQDS